MPRAKGLQKRDFLKQVEEQAAQADQRCANDAVLIGKEYFRNPDVNKGFYSRKRVGVADVDPKVSYHFLPPFIFNPMLNQYLRALGHGAI